MHAAGGEGDQAIVMNINSVHGGVKKGQKSACVFNQWPLAVQGGVKKAKKLRAY